MKTVSILLMIALTFGILLSVGNMTNEQYFSMVSNMSESIKYQIDNINITIEKMPHLEGSINYIIYGFGNAICEIIIWISELVYSYPNAPYKLLMIGICVSILSPIIITLFKLFIIIFLLVRNKIQDNKEKKRFNR
jgi:predicted PurR-regulated permease PerM